MKSEVCRLHWTHKAMSRMASVRYGKTSGSLSIGRHDKGPCFWYVSKKESRASLRCPWLLSLSIRITVSGDRIPWAVGNAGSVSQDASTELDNLTEVFRVVSSTRGFPGFLSIFWAVMWGIWEEDVVGGVYLRVDFFPLGDRNAFWFEDHAKPLDRHIMKTRAIAPNRRPKDLARSCSILLIILKVKCRVVFQWLWWYLLMDGWDRVVRTVSWCACSKYNRELGLQGFGYLSYVMCVAGNEWRMLLSDARQRQCRPIRNTGRQIFRKRVSGSFSSKMRKQSARFVLQSCCSCATIATMNSCYF